MNTVFYIAESTFSITLCDAGVITGKYGYYLCTCKQTFLKRGVMT